MHYCKVKQMGRDGKWATVTKCFYRTHAEMVMRDCKKRWPDRSFVLKVIKEKL